jgi:hypothetical protein
MKKQEGLREVLCDIARTHKLGQDSMDKLEESLEVNFDTIFTKEKENAGNLRSRKR